MVTEEKKDYDQNEDLESNLDLNPNLVDGFIETGLSSNSGRPWYILETNQLLVVAIFGVMGGFISSIVPFSQLVKVWYPLPGGTQLMSGHHIIWATLSYGITKRKVSCVYCMFIKGILEMLLGDSWGAFIIVINLIEGAGVALGFIVMKRFNEETTTLGWALAAGLGNFTQAPIFWYLTGRIYILHPTIAILAFIFAFISGAVIGGVLGKKISERVLRALE